MRPFLNFFSSSFFHPFFFSVSFCSSSFRFSLIFVFFFFLCFFFFFFFSFSFSFFFFFFLFLFLFPFFSFFFSYFHLFFFLFGRCHGPPRKGEKRKGKNRSDRKVNCVTRRVLLFFWALWSKNAFLPERCPKKNLEALSPESGAIGGAKGPQTRGRAHSGLPCDFLVLPVRGVISGMCPGTRAVISGMCPRTRGVTFFFPLFFFLFFLFFVCFFFCMFFFFLFRGAEMLFFFC